MNPKPTSDNVRPLIRLIDGRFGSSAGRTMAKKRKSHRRARLAIIRLECTVDFSSENSTRKFRKTKHSLMITISGLQNDYVNDYENLYESMPDEEVKSEQSYSRLEIDDHRNGHISAEQYDTILSSRTNSAEYSYEYSNYFSRQYKYENVDRPNSDTHYYHEESLIDENKQDCRHVIAPESPPQNLHRKEHSPIFMERSTRRHPLFGNSRSVYSPKRDNWSSTESD
ncbi:hypothetical protein Q1695_004868 [Nippostrongylus brasiliensis]|nr:hypothetical protein Q1695_004868 [Nippostrongylus brasiliensis]